MSCTGQFSRFRMLRSLKSVREVYIHRTKDLFEAMHGNCSPGRLTQNVSGRGMSSSRVMYMSTMSSSNQMNPPPPQRSGEELEEDERQGKKQEEKFRTYKKVFSTLLFGTTFGLALYGRRRKNTRLAENLKDCVRLPNDDNYQGGHKEFFRCKNPDVPDSVGCVLPAQILRDGTILALKTFEIRGDDVFVASFPKSGTTWMQEIVYLIKNDLNFVKASEDVMETRFPYLEFPYPGLSSLKKLPSPRLIKTHLPYDLLPPNVGKAKIIYILRNPKDTAVSYYYFARMLAFSSYHGTMNEFLDKFKKDEVPYAPYFGHLESYLRHQDDPNLLIIKYEDLSKDPGDVIRRVAIFLEHPLSDEDVGLLVAHTDFEHMSKNSSVNYSHWDSLGIRNQEESHFLRKGKVGDWREHFMEGMNESFDAWISKNNKTRVSFDYDI